jgi:hypothetical protein
LTQDFLFPLTSMPSANKGSIPNTIRAELLFGAKHSSKPETSYLKGYTSQLIATR